MEGVVNKETGRSAVPYRSMCGDLVAQVSQSGFFKSELSNSGTRAALLSRMAISWHLFSATLRPD